MGLRTGLEGLKGLGRGIRKVAVSGSEEVRQCDTCIKKGVGKPDSWGRKPKNGIGWGTSKVDGQNDEGPRDIGRSMAGGKKEETSKREEHGTTSEGLIWTRMASPR